MLQLVHDAAPFACYSNITMVMAITRIRCLRQILTSCP